ncbi:alanine:cation symporter family protein, partial [Escherichia coli]|uniref:alanine:cation symporter family protein n=1 Tax=Escherichia coli TaxID=562 RepID=UPI003D186F59
MNPLVWCLWADVAAKLRSLKRMQFRYIRQFGKSLKNSIHPQPGGLTSFQSLCTSLAARVGSGNLAGVALAITAGGPGAVFWMWVAA